MEKQFLMHFHFFILAKKLSYKSAFFLRRQSSYTVSNIAMNGPIQRMVTSEDRSHSMGIEYTLLNMLDVELTLCNDYPKTSQVLVDPKVTGF